MAAGTSVWFCLIICLPLCSCGALVFIPVELGQDVTLTCKVPNNKPITAVKWNRPELDKKYVLLYRDGRFVPEHQHPSYKNRVDLKDREMKDGDVSLILKNVTMEDRGRYECWVDHGETNRRKRSILTSDPINSIYLEVGPPGDKDRNSLGLPGVKDPEIIRVKHGQDVNLTCKAPNNKTVSAVEWSRPGLDPDHVLLYRNGRFDPDNQHPSYVNRVDLKVREMKDGDVSLILKNVKMEDRGRYECRVFQGGKNRRKRSSSTNDPISIIHLEVDPGDTGAGWNEVGISLGVVGFLLTAVTLVGFLIYKRRNMRQNPNLPVPPDEAAAEQML